MGFRHQLRRLLSERVSKHRRTSRAKHNRYRPALESLEPRALMTGFWQLLNPGNPTAGPPGTSDTGGVMLLSDGEVLIQGGITPNAAAPGGFDPSKTWYRLSPTSTGNYITGTWGSQSQMAVGRLYATSAMLPSSQVIIVGGEYSTPFDFTNSVETYDPQTNVWTQKAGVPTPPTQASVRGNPPPVPTSQFGDDPIEVLPNGELLAGYFADSQTYIYNPSNNTWRLGPTKLRDDDSDEENWAKLPDQSILAVDITGSISDAGKFHAQRYVPALNQWIDASHTDPGNPPLVATSAAFGFEQGPLITLPDGDRTWLVGANGQTAYYLIATDTWIAGPQLPTVNINGVATQLGGTDNPAAVLPNGKILIALSPNTGDGFGGLGFNSPAFVFEFDPATNTFTDVSASLIGQINAFELTMLMLPTGQVLLSDQDGPIQVYNPDGAPKDSWRPTIQAITDNKNGTFTLTGTQLNGVSEGAVYGDDWSMSSNYPIIRLTEKNGNISYARTFNWSSTGIQTGSTRQTTQFTLPNGRSLTDFTNFTVIANGIPSLSFQNSTLPGQITGIKYNDLNHNGMREPGEPGVSHVTIFVDLNNDGKLSILEPAAVTDNFGRYTIKNLPPRVDYVVREMAGPGGVQTQPGPLGNNFGAGPLPAIPFVYTNVIVSSNQGAVLDFGNDLTNANDFGDAPDSYGTTLAANGARHGILIGFHLGLKEDGEPNGQPTANATGDDVTGVDDEDGVFFGALTPGQGFNGANPATITVSVSVGGNSPGKLQGWIDFNQDGKFDASEKVISNKTLGAGTAALPVNVPTSAKLGTTFARFRYGYETDLGPTGSSIAGEVEDYQVTILPTTPIANPDVFPRPQDLQPGGQGIIKPNTQNYHLDVLANDTPSASGPPQIQPGSFPLVLPNTLSTLSLAFDAALGRQVLIYSAGPGVTGGSQEIFTYRVNDGNGHVSAPGQVTINISLADNIAIDDTYTLPATGAVLASQLDVMQNDLTSHPAGTQPGDAQIINVVWVQQDPARPQQTSMSIDLADPTLLDFTAPADFRGTEIYAYTIDENPDDPTTAPSTRFVTVQVIDPEVLNSPPGAFDADLRAANYLAELDVAVLDLNGIPTSMVHVGDQFFLQITSHDLRPGGSTADRGVESAFLDLLFSRGNIAPVPDPDSSLPMQAITFDPRYSLLQSGQDGVNNAPQADEINEAGAAHDTQGHGPPPVGVGPGFVNVFMVRMQAKAATGGTPIEVRGDPPDELTDVTIMGSPGSMELTNDQVFFRQSNPLTVLSDGEGEFVNASNPLDVDQDTLVSPVDALIVINTLNADGSRSLRGLSPAANYAMIDTNMDSMLSPVDALVVINGLNRLNGWLASHSTSGGGGEGEGEGESEVSSGIADTSLALLSTQDSSASGSSSTAIGATSAVVLTTSTTSSTTADGSSPAAVTSDQDDSCPATTSKVDANAADDLYASLGQINSHLTSYFRRP